MGDAAKRHKSFISCFCIPCYRYSERHELVFTHLPSLPPRPFRSIDELIGRADLLRQRDVQLAKTSGLDLSFLTTFAGASGKSSERIRQAVHTDGELLDDRILAEKDVMEAIKSQVGRGIDAVCSVEGEGLATPRPTACICPFPAPIASPTLRPTHSSVTFIRAPSTLNSVPPLIPLSSPTLPRAPSPRPITSSTLTGLPSAVSPAPSRAITGTRALRAPSRLR